MSLLNIHNVVARFNVNCKLDLQDIAMRSYNCLYRPTKFVGLVMKLETPTASALVFHSGKIVVTGCRTEALADLACRKITRLLYKLDYDVEMTQCTICNMVATFATHHCYVLNEMAKGLLKKRQNCSVRNFFAFLAEKE